MLIDEKRLYWLAGLLEGEASFMLTRSTKTNGPQPLIRIAMTDADIIQQVAGLFSVAVIEIPARRNHWKAMYLTRVQGKRAYFLMQILEPLLGQRRQAKIRSILSAYSYVPNHVGSNNESAKLNEAQVRQIKQRIAQGETAKSIAQDFAVTHYAIWAIRSGKTWSHVSAHDENRAAPEIENPIQVISGASEDAKTLHWLAGLLEGEGSFVPPPPSAPNQPAIQIAMTDEDVVARAADLFGVKYHSWQRKNSGHKVSYQAALRGGRAVEYMQKLYPLMGKRRQEQIHRALSEYTIHDKRGDRNPRSKLSTEQVVEIKKRLLDGEHPKSIAPDFNVNHFTIVDIKLGRTWQHVTV